MRNELVKTYWNLQNRFKYFRQVDHMDCGPTCIRMIASFYGREYSLEYLKENSALTKEGVSLSGLSNLAEKIGFKTLSVKLTYEQLLNNIPLPCILHWDQAHFVVLYDIKRTLPGMFSTKNREWFIIGDPGHDLLKMDKLILEKFWISSDSNKGIALLLEPTDEFHLTRGSKKEGEWILNSIIKKLKDKILKVVKGI